MIWTLIVILIVLWLFGLLSGIGSYYIHLFIVIAVVVLVYRLLTRTD